MSHGYVNIPKPVFPYFLSGKTGVGILYVSAWGFFVIRSDELGNARAFRTWDEQQAMVSTSFLYMDVSKES